MKITISGTPGSGKSTIAKLLAKKLNLAHYYMGGMRREIARRHGMTLEELNKLGEKEDWTDREVDDYQKELGAKEDNFIMEGRTSYFLIPDSIKIFIKCDLEEGARRIWNDLEKDPKKRNEANVHSYEELLESLKRRVQSDKKRYLKYYDQDYTDESQYDLIVDTTDLSIEETLEKVGEFIETR